MARLPDARVEQAKAMFLEGKKLTEIATALGIPEGTVRRWKSVYRWKSERSDKNSERSKKNNERSDRKKSKNKIQKEQKKAVAYEVAEVLENPDLTDKQRLFCLHYVRCFNATKAYQQAYDCDRHTAQAIAYRMLENVGVKEEIRRLKQARLNRELLDEHDIFQRYIDIAFADITDFVEFDKSGVRLKSSNEVDGTLIAEVKQIRGDVSVRLPDRLQALKWLTEHLDMATEEQKARIAVLKARAGDTDEDEMADDGFIEALEAAAADWKEEE